MLGQNRGELQMGELFLLIESLYYDYQYVHWQKKGIIHFHF